MHSTRRDEVRVSAIRPMFMLSVRENGGRTFAKAELCWDGSYLAGEGVAYRHPCDHLAGEAARELATARALSDLADRVAAPRRVNA